MIITLKGANFSGEGNNIGTLKSYSIRFVGSGVTNSNTSVDRESNTGYTTTITIGTGYELNGSITVTMGGTDITSTAVSGLNINIQDKVTGNVVITVPTKNTATGEEGEPDNPDVGGGEEETSDLLDLSAGTLIEGKTLASETYTTNDVTSGYFTVMEVPAEPNTTYNIESGVLRRTWYVDSSKTGISSVNLKSEKTFTTTENTAYISFTCATSDCSYNDIVIKKA